MGGSPPGSVSRPPLVVIGGPTATGKTGLAIRLALAVTAETGRPAEIVSADSRQVYCGLDIATAKPSLAERAGVVHHGLDLVEPDAPFSVADFARHADPALADLAGRGGVAILVGGTGLWLRAIASGLDLTILPADPATRTAVEAELTHDGLAAVVARLRTLAPGIAARTDLANPRRVARAMEVARLAGDVALPAPRGYGGPLLRIGLELDPATNRAWIARRALAQLEAGLLDEAAAVRARYPETLRSLSAIGYREAWDLLDGRIDREAYLATNVARNAGLAKRQRTWFRVESTDLTLAADDDPWAAARGRVGEFLAAARLS